jgi:hypothetical protein
MIELFLDSPIELQVLILGVLILIGKEMFK